ncbi:MAG TPA: hypothetical protein EYP43_04570, partial [Thermoplasmata archaeon]|nr:hypothetical protein [Thermoplasmata archaeon]
MARSTMNRWIVVVFAILIQLALGAIYAWSVFTPGLTLPLEEKGFEEDTMVVIDGTEYTVVLGGVLEGPVVDSDPQEMTLDLVADDGTSYGGNLRLLVTSYITDEDGDRIGKVVVKGKTVYRSTDSAEKYTYLVTYSGGPVAHDVNLTANGNWHFDIVIVDSDGANVTDATASLLVNEGLVGDFGFSPTQAQMIFSAGLATFAVMTIVAGKIVTPRIGPRWTSMLGGILLGGG